MLAEFGLLSYHVVEGYFLFGWRRGLRSFPFFDCLHVRNNIVVYHIVGHFYFVLGQSDQLVTFLQLK